MDKKSKIQTKLTNQPQQIELLINKTQQIEIRLKTPVFHKRNVKTWNPQQDQMLFRLYQQFPKKWNKIAEMMKNRNQNQCLHRYRRLIQVGKHKKTWSSEEDRVVLEMVEKFGNNWKFIATTLKTKTGKQIRQRYINKLDPSIKKQQWSQAQDLKIIELFTKYGSKWSDISKDLPGRPENRIKNRFHSYIQKNYDVLVKDEGINIPQKSLEILFESKLKKSSKINIIQDLINVLPIPQQKKIGQMQKDFLENNQKQKYHEQRVYFSKNYLLNLGKPIYNDWDRQEFLQEINESNDIAFENHHENQDLLYFDED